MCAQTVNTVMNFNMGDILHNMFGGISFDYKTSLLLAHFKIVWKLTLAAK